MKLVRSIPVKRRVSLDKESAAEMHALGAAYVELGMYWLQSGIAPRWLAEYCYETACHIHVLADCVDELADKRERAANKPKLNQTSDADEQAKRSAEPNRDE